MSAVLQFDSDADRHASLARALDGLHRRVRADLGEADVRRVRRLYRFSRAMEVVGRVLIHVSPEPVTFLAGVGALWVHKQLQMTEIGHPVLHGSYDKLEGADGFRSREFTWMVPIDEEAWHEGHNLAHHPYTNVAGRDPDMHFGPVRLTERTPHRWFHRFQVPFTLLGSVPSFTFSMNLHFTGLLDVGRGGEGGDHEPPPFRQAAWRALRKFVPYYGKEYVLFPLLAGPMFAKVILGNALSELLRDVYSAASIHCGHIGEDVAAYAPGTRSGGRGGWYAMQIRSAHNFQVPYGLSVLCGGLDHQIEHHLFPKLPPERLRQIAPEVRAICEAHGLPYRTGPWLRVLGEAIGELHRLSFPAAGAVPTEVAP